MEPSVFNKTRLRRGKIFGLNPNVFFLGMVSLLTDVSSEMIFTLLPLFLSNVLGAATTIIQWLGQRQDWQAQVSGSIGLQHFYYS